MENNTNLPQNTAGNVPTADEIMNEVAQISAANVEVPSVDSIQTPTVQDIPATPSVEVQPQAVPTAAAAPVTQPIQTAQAAPAYAAPVQNTAPSYAPPAPTYAPVAQNPVPVQNTAPVQNAAPVQNVYPTANTVPQGQTIPTGNYQYANTGLLQDESEKMLKKKARNYGLGAIGLVVLFWVLTFAADISSGWLLIIPIVLAFSSLKSSKGKSVAGWFGMILSVLSVVVVILAIVLAVASSVS